MTDTPVQELAIQRDDGVAEPTNGDVIGHLLRMILAWESVEKLPSGFGGTLNDHQVRFQH